MISGLLVAAVKEAVWPTSTPSQAAGLEPVEVDLIPFALTRALIAGNSAAGTVALVHVGAVTTTVVVAIDGIPQFVRIIQNGSEDITNALSTRLGIDNRQADQVKRGFGLTTEGISADWRPAVEVIYQATGDLMGGIRNTLSFYISTRPGAVIDKIFVSGGGAEMTGFSAALAETMRIPVFTPNALERFGIATHGLPGERRRRIRRTACGSRPRTRERRMSIKALPSRTERPARGAAPSRGAASRYGTARRPSPSGDRRAQPQKAVRRGLKYVVMCRRRPRPARHRRHLGARHRKPDRAGDRAGEHAEPDRPAGEVRRRPKAAQDAITLGEAAERVGGSTEIDWLELPGQAAGVACQRRRHHQRAHPLVGSDGRSTRSRASRSRGLASQTLTFTAVSPTLPHIPDWLDRLRGLCPVSWTRARHRHTGVGGYTATHHPAHRRAVHIPAASRPTGRPPATRLPRERPPALTPPTAPPTVRRTGPRPPARLGNHQRSGHRHADDDRRRKVNLDNRIWIALTVVVCGVLVAGGWFLGAQPQLNAAAAADVQQGAAIVHNAELTSRTRRWRSRSRICPHCRLRPH